MTQENGQNNQILMCLWTGDGRVTSVFYHQTGNKHVQREGWEEEEKMHIKIQTEKEQRSLNQLQVEQWWNAVSSVWGPGREPTRSSGSFHPGWCHSDPSGLSWTCPGLCHWCWAAWSKGSGSGGGNREVTNTAAICHHVHCEGSGDQSII